MGTPHATQGAERNGDGCVSDGTRKEFEASARYTGKQEDGALGQIALPGKRQRFLDKLGMRTGERAVDAPVTAHTTPASGRTAR